MTDENVTFAEKKDLIWSVCTTKGFRRRYRYSRHLVNALYQLVLAVREDSITAVEQYWHKGAVTTIAKFRYSGRDYEMSVCERRNRSSGRFCWVNIQTLPHMTDYDVTFKAPFDERVTYEQILGELKALREKNAHKISAHKRNEHDRRQQNRQRAAGRKRVTS